MRGLGAPQQERKGCLWGTDQGPPAVLILPIHCVGPWCCWAALGPTETSLCAGGQVEASGLGKPRRSPAWPAWVFAALIRQFVSDVAWGQLDYLVVDTPPGTSDEHMAAVDALRPYSPLGALVVTTPQVRWGSVPALRSWVPLPAPSCQGAHWPVSPLSCSPGSVCGGCAAGADLL